MKRIIDVSEHQKEIDWVKVKQEVDGVILRIGYGDDDSAQDDKYFLRNITECERLGIPYEVYLYSYADSDAHISSEIAHIKRLLAGRNVRVWLDLEYRPAQKYWRKAVTAFLKAFPSGGVYSWEWVFTDILDGIDCPRWICAYGSNSGKPEADYKPVLDCHGWQYTSRAHISGINGYVDMSEWYGDFAEAVQKPITGREAVVAKIRSWEGYNERSGQAADAKVVGDEIGELKEDLSDINNEVFEIDNISIPITYTRKYISSAGTWNTSQISSASDYFAVTPNQRVVLSGVLLTDQNCIAAFYANKKFASKIAGGTNDTTVSFVVPEDCYYIAVTAPLDATAVEGKTFLSSNIKENADKIQKLEAVSFNKTIQFFLTDILRELAWTITNGDGLIESFEQIMGRKSIVVGEPYDYALVSDEYVTKTGIIEGYASWSRTNAIPCDSVDFLVFTGNGAVFTTAGYSVFYDKDMNFISNFTVTLTNDITSVTIPVPQNANTFIISGHTRQFANLVSIVPTRGE